MHSQIHGQPHNQSHGCQTNSGQINELKAFRLPKGFVLKSGAFGEETSNQRPQEQDGEEQIPRVRNNELIASW